MGASALVDRIGVSGGLSWVHRDRPDAVGPDGVYVKEDGGADPAARAAAAIALGPALDDAERQRLRRIARVVVSPKLRVAIEAAAEGDDEHVVEALAALDDAQERRTS